MKIYTKESYSNEHELLEELKSTHENVFTSLAELEKEAKEFFLSITRDLDDQSGYFTKFGLEIGEVFVRNIDTKIVDYKDDYSTMASLHSYECYIDSGSDDYYNAILVEMH